LAEDEIVKGLRNAGTAGEVLETIKRGEAKLAES